MSHRFIANDINNIDFIKECAMRSSRPLPQGDRRHQRPAINATTRVCRDQPPGGELVTGQDGVAVGAVLAARYRTKLVLGQSVRKDVGVSREAVGAVVTGAADVFMGQRPRERGIAQIVPVTYDRGSGLAVTGTF
jgi:hypothetical protein